MIGNIAATPEYATAKIAVWWDMKGCPIPEGYDARRVRPSMEAAFKELGYSGPVSITAYGDQKQTSCHLLRGLSSTGVVVAHTKPEITYKLMYKDMLEWRAHNPPPATMMLISDKVQDVFAFDLVRLQQQTQYNLFLAYPSSPCYMSVLVASAEWRWKSLLEPKSALIVEDKCSETSELSAMFYCKSCCFDCQSLEDFRKHLSSKKHAVQEVLKSADAELDDVTRMWGKNYPAKPEYATAKIAVWWNMMDCPIPEGYDARRVRPSIEAAFKELGYSGPVSITAYGDQKQTSCHLLRGLSSTGVVVAHTKPEITYKLMYKDMLEWRAHNPPPATMMLISDKVQDVFAFDLVRLQQQTQYNLFLAYPSSPCYMSVLVASAEWRWKSLLEPKSALIVEDKCSETSELSAMFYCKSCCFDCQSLEDFRKHLSSKKHAVQEVLKSADAELDDVTRMWGKNYPAKPEYATAKIAVWWNMMDCPIPEGYDARRVRPSIEAAFKELGYSGPVSITAYGDQRQTPDHILRGLSSTGIALAHTIPEVTYKRMRSDLSEWQDHNPPPATMMLISDLVEVAFSDGIVRRQQRKKLYNLFLGYSYRPYKMSVLVTSAEWLWESLLAVSKTTRHVLLHKCSENVLQKCSGRGTESTTEMFYCKVCFCDCKSLDDFTKHLSSEEHAEEEDEIHACKRENKLDREHWEKEEVVAFFAKRKRLRKAFGTGFGHLHNHLRPRNRRRARRRALKSQTSKKGW